VDLYIARQPIFDATRDVVGYELLFRDGLSNCFAGTDGNEATRQVLLNTFVLFGLSRLTGGKPAFINFTREFLFNDLIRLFPPHSVVVEILEDIPAEPEVVAACRWMKESGYTLALDDVTALEPCGELLDIADIVKVDFRATPPAERRGIAKRLMGTTVRLLAEKVETYQEFRAAVDEGFALFQGYFFSKPEIMRKRDVPGNQGQYLRLVRELRRPDVTVDALEKIIKQDISLSYRLLKYINSPLFGLRSEIRSVRHALTLLGERDVRRWAMLAALAGVAPEKPSELLETGLLRARFCETLSGVLGPDARDAADEMFLVGLFSVLDALLDVSLEEAVRDAGVPARVKSALLGVPSPLRDVLDLVSAYERGEWETVTALLDALHVDLRAVAQVFVESVDWARRASRVQNDAPWSSVPPANNGPKSRT
jgi:EAL and modified HD-GYP domain-containing signal transduction protein